MVRAADLSRRDLDVSAFVAARRLGRDQLAVLVDRDRRGARRHAPRQRADPVHARDPRGRHARDADDHPLHDVRFDRRRRLPRQADASGDPREQLDHAGAGRRGRERSDGVRPVPRRLGVVRHFRRFVRSRAQRPHLGRGDLQRRVPGDQRLGSPNESLPRPHRVHAGRPRAPRAHPHRQPARALDPAEHRAVRRDGLAHSAWWADLDRGARDHVTRNAARRGSRGAERSMEHVRGSVPQRRSRVAAVLCGCIGSEPSSRRVVLRFHPPRAGAEPRRSRGDDRRGAVGPLLARRDVRLLHRRGMAHDRER